MLGQFVASVASGRSMKVEDVKTIADGKIWTGEQAKSMKLVDEIGDFETVVQANGQSCRHQGRAHAGPG